MIDFIKNNLNISIKDLNFITGKRRTQRFPYRLVVYANNISNLQSQLEFYLNNNNNISNLDIIRNNVINTDKKVSKVERKLAFVFPGQGSFLDISKNYNILINSSKAFCETITKLEEIFIKLNPDFILSKVINSISSSVELFNKLDSSISQSIIFSVQAALFNSFKEISISPKAVVGDSVGKIAAIYASGMLSLEDAAKIVYLRGKSLNQIKGKGAMIIARSDSLTLCSLYNSIEQSGTLENLGRIETAAINSQLSTTLTGTKEALQIISKH